jgi:uncharacterized delta-60 repeat protein
VTTAFGTGTLGNDYAYGVAVQEDGMIVVVGYAYNGTNNDFAVARYNSDGSPDTTFGTSGKVTTAIGTENDLAYAVTIQGDGMILVAGNASNGTNMDFAVVRYTTNGALDTTFNTTGKVTTAIGTGGDFAIGVAVQADGKIVLAGYSSNGTNFDFAVVRYAANGALDTSFGTTGKTTTAIGSGEDFATGMAIQGNGKIVLVGRSINGTLYNWSMARYNTNGSLDATFGTNGNGKVTTNITPSYEIAPGNEGAQGIAIQDDGKIVAAGYYYGGLKSNFALARYNTNGSLDTGFGANGVVTQAIGNTNDGGMAVALDGSSKIVVAGYSSNGVNNDFAVARFWP